MTNNKFNCMCGSVVNVSSKNRHFKSKKHIKYEEEQKNKKPEIKKKPKDEQRSKNKKIYKMLKNFYGFMLQSNKVFCQKKAFIIADSEEDRMIEIYYNYYNKENTKYKPIKKLFKKFQKIFREYIRNIEFQETPDLEYDFYLLNLEVSTVIQEAKQKLKNKIDFNINDLINDSEKILYASESPKFFKNLEEARERKKGKGIITLKELEKTDPKKAEEVWQSVLPQIEYLIKMNNIKLK